MAALVMQRPQDVAALDRAIGVVGAVVGDLLNGSACGGIAHVNWRLEPSFSRSARTAASCVASEDCAALPSPAVSRRASLTS
jgi:hypothetical protein